MMAASAGAAGGHAVHARLIAGGCGSAQPAQGWQSMETFKAVVILLLMLLSGCSSTPDEQQVREAIQSAATAARQGKVGPLANALTDDFDGNAGELDRRQLLGMLRVQHLRGDAPGVLLGPVHVEARGERLVAGFTVSLSAGDSRLPDRLGVYTVESAWKRDGKTWRCYSASWKRKL